MKKIGLVIMAIVLLSIPQFAGASTVFETAGFITGTDGVTFGFEADTAPFTYKATLSDLSEAPFFMRFFMMSKAHLSVVLASLHYYLVIARLGCSYLFHYQTK